MTENEIKKSDEEVSSALKEKFSFPMKRTAVQINRNFFKKFLITINITMLLANWSSDKSRDT